MLIHVGVHGTQDVHLVWDKAGMIIGQNGMISPWKILAHDHYIERTFAMDDLCTVDRTWSPDIGAPLTHLPVIDLQKEQIS